MPTAAPAATAAHRIKLSIENLRMRCPKSQIVLVKILPAFDPAKEVGAQVKNINAALDALKLDADANVHVLDLWSDFTNADATLKIALYSDDHLHLGPAGYEVFGVSNTGSKWWRFTPSSRASRRTRSMTGSAAIG